MKSPHHKLTMALRNLSRYVLLPGFCLLLFAKTADAQRLKDWLQLAEEALAENDPYGALRYMEEVMALDSARAQHNYTYAEALRLNHRYDKAGYYYYKIFRRDQGRFYPDAGPHLADMYKRTGNYTESKKIWRRVRDQHADVPEAYAYRKAVQEMRACDLAALWMEETEGFGLRPVPEGSNSEGSEFAGTVTPGGHLVFSALRGKLDEKGRVLQEDQGYHTHLYFAEGPDWENSLPIHLSSTSNAEANFASNQDSSYTAMSVVLDDGRQEIHIAGGDYGPAMQRLLPHDESDIAYYSHPAFGEIDAVEVLFFTSDRSGGEGMLDIWYIDLHAKGALPQNPGPPLNTPGNEASPFFRKDKQQLYFASDWHHGFGAYDLFSSNVENAQFMMPQNMKKPWNTPSNDLYYSFSEANSVGTITSNRPGAMQHANEGCCNDLWHFAEAQFEYMDTLHIQTLEELNNYLPVTLFFHNDEPEPRTTKDSTSQGYFDTYYAYVDLLPQYQATYRSGLDPDAGVEAEEAMDRFFLERIDQGVRDLARFAPLLLQELREGQQIQLTIKGFASPLARTDYNVKLTSRRITSLVNYLHGYEGGGFKPYLEGNAASGGRLEIIRIPFGEYVAQAFVSDNPNESNAIWSIAAALERKIEISSVQRAPSDSSFASLSFRSEIIDLGLVKPGSQPGFSFVFEVGNDAELMVDSMVYNDTALQLDALDTRYPSGATGSISGILKGPLEKGKQQLSLVLFGNIAGDKRVLNLVLEVE